MRDLGRSAAFLGALGSLFYACRLGNHRAPHRSSRARKALTLDPDLLRQLEAPGYVER